VLIVPRDVLIVVWRVDVAARVGSGRAAAETGTGVPEDPPWIDRKLFPAGGATPAAEPWIAVEEASTGIIVPEATP
jgi:hypothetical protein